MDSEARNARRMGEPLRSPRMETFSRKVSYSFLFLMVLPMRMRRYVSRSMAHNFTAVLAYERRREGGEGRGGEGREGQRGG